MKFDFDVKDTFEPIPNEQMTITHEPEVKQTDISDKLSTELNKFDKWVDKWDLTQKSSDEVRLKIVEIFQLIERDKK